MQSFAILLLCIGSAICYGIVHDQVTARICVEYFTIGHPPLFDTDDPTLLGLGWGVVATWWVGLLLGLPLAIAARAGRRPKVCVKNLIQPILVLLVVMGFCAALAGTLGWVLTDTGIVRLDIGLPKGLPRDKTTAFTANWWAHNMSYLVGFVGGIVVIGHVWRSRGAASSTGRR